MTKTHKRKATEYCFRDIIEKIANYYYSLDKRPRKQKAFKIKIAKIYNYLPNIKPRERLLLK